MRKIGEMFVEDPGEEMFSLDSEGDILVSGETGLVYHHDCEECEEDGQVVCMGHLPARRHGMLAGVYVYEDEEEQG